MALNEILLVLRWWGMFFLLSVTVLPLTAVLFRSFFDKGYIFSKAISLILLSYITLLFGTLQVFPFTSYTLIFYLLLITVLSYFGLSFIPSFETGRKHLPALISKYWKIIFVEEVLFLAGLFFLAYIRAFSPDIHGLEKYMDYGFMNSILRSDVFPPKDMWLTPFSINYYYFGHFTGAVLTKLSHIAPNLSYNLILAGVFSLSFTMAFSLGANLFHLIGLKGRFQQLKTTVAGLLTAFLVTLAGNLHTMYAFFSPYENEKPVPVWELSFLPASFPNSYWYPNATRFIYNTIHEFPIYSWVVADLHGHVFDIPFALTTLALLLSFLVTFSQKNTQGSSTMHKKSSLSSIIRNHPFPMWSIPILGFMLSVLYMTNAWDGLIYLLLSGLFILYIHLVLFPQKQKRSWRFLLSAPFMFPLVLSGSILFISFSVFSLPFSLHFKPFVSGIGVLCAPEFLVQMKTLGPFLFEADHCQRSPWWQLMMLYGFFYIYIFSFLIFLFKVRKVRISDTYVLLLIILGTLLILIPEFIYVKDIYPAHYRANTMFKLVFQSFILFSVVSSYTIVRITSAMRSRTLTFFEKLASVGFILLTLLLLTLVGIYPVQAINSYYGELKHYAGIDGTKYLEKLYPSDYQAIRWLNEHVTGQPVILEAQGDSYTDYARVSANTGLPTVLGWTVHEWLWRNSYDVPNPPADPNVIYEVPAPRIVEVQTLYETADITETRRLLQKYTIEYVFLGALERQKYPSLNEEKWNHLGERIFSHDSTMIYRVTK